MFDQLFLAFHFASKFVFGDERLSSVANLMFILLAKDILFELTGIAWQKKDPVNVFKISSQNVAAKLMLCLWLLQSLFSICDFR